MRKTPDTLEQLKREAAQISAQLVAFGAEEKQAEVGVIGDFLASAEQHLEDADAGGYYETEHHQVHLDIAAAYAALAKAGARAIALRLDHADPPDNSN